MAIVTKRNSCTKLSAKWSVVQSECQQKRKTETGLKFGQTQNGYLSARERFTRSRWVFLLPFYVVVWPVPILPSEMPSLLMRLHFGLHGVKSEHSVYEYDNTATPNGHHQNRFCANATQFFVCFFFIVSELYFLITKFLSNGPFQNVGEVIIILPFWMFTKSIFTNPMRPFFFLFIYFCFRFRSFAKPSKNRRWVWCNLNIKKNIIMFTKILARRPPPPFPRDASFYCPVTLDTGSLNGVSIYSTFKNGRISGLLQFFFVFDAGECIFGHVLLIRKILSKLFSKKKRPSLLFKVIFSRVKSARTFSLKIWIVWKIVDSKFSWANIRNRPVFENSNIFGKFLLSNIRQRIPAAAHRGPQMAIEKVATLANCRTHRMNEIFVFVLNGAFCNNSNNNTGGSHVLGRWARAPARRSCQNIGENGRAVATHRWPVYVRSHIRETAVAQKK